MVYNAFSLDRVRKIFRKFPRHSVPQHLELADDDDLQKLSEAIAAAKTRVEGCSSFLKAAIKLDTFLLLQPIHIYISMFILFFENTSVSVPEGLV